MSGSGDQKTLENICDGPLEVVVRLSCNVGKKQQKEFTFQIGSGMKVTKTFGLAETKDFCLAYFSSEFQGSIGISGARFTDGYHHKRIGQSTTSPPPASTPAPRSGIGAGTPPAVRAEVVGSSVIVHAVNFEDRVLTCALNFQWSFDSGGRRDRRTESARVFLTPNFKGQIFKQSGSYTKVSVDSEPLLKCS